MSPNLSNNVISMSEAAPHAPHVVAPYSAPHNVPHSTSHAPHPSLPALMTHGSGDQEDSAGGVVYATSGTGMSGRGDATFAREVRDNVNLELREHATLELQSRHEADKSRGEGL